MKSMNLKKIGMIIGITIIGILVMMGLMKPKSDKTSVRKPSGTTSKSKTSQKTTFSRSSVK